MSDLINDGMTKVVWASSIANINAPTTTELNAAADYTPRVTPDGLKLDPATRPVVSDGLRLILELIEARGKRRDFDEQWDRPHDGG